MQSLYLHVIETHSDTHVTSLTVLITIVQNGEVDIDVRILTFLCHNVGLHGMALRHCARFPRLSRARMSDLALLPSIVPSKKIFASGILLRRRKSSETRGHALTEHLEYVTDYSCWSLEVWYGAPRVDRYQRPTIENKT